MKKGIFLSAIGIESAEMGKPTKKEGERMDFIKLILVSLLSVAVLFLITKLMGHKQVAQLDFFDYVSGITIGSIGAELATELESPMRPLISLLIYGAVSVVLRLLSQRIPRTRKFINGTPTILMSGGVLYRSNMKKAKIDLSEFMLLCREQGYFDLSDIECAVFEADGRLSVLPKAASRPVAPRDLGMTVSENRIGTELIMDGCILEENLSRIGRDERWLKGRLSESGYADARGIFLAIYHSENDRLTVYPTA